MFWKKCFSFIAVSAFVIMALTGTAQAVNTHADFVLGNPVHEPQDDNNVFIQSNVLDLSGLTTYPAGGVSTGDVVQMLDIQAGTFVMHVGIQVYTATHAGNTLEGTPVCVIGDGDDPNGWMTLFDISSKDSGVSTSIEDGGAGVYQTLAGGKYYSSDDTIDLTLPTFGATHDGWTEDPASGLTTVVLKVWALCIKPDTQKAYGKLR